MVYLLYGRNLPQLNYYLDKIKLENSDAEVVYCDFPIDKNFLISNLYTSPMLTKKRLVIFENQNFSEIDFDRINQNTILIILQRGQFRPRLPKFGNLVVIEAKGEASIFKFLNNLVLQSVTVNLSQILKILKFEEPNFIFHQLITHIRRLILVKSGKSIEKLADWQIKKYNAIANSTTSEKLKKAYQMLLATEIEVKLGKQELSTTLPILILKLTQHFKTS